MAAHMLRKNLQMLKHIFPCLWKSRLSYRQCSTLKQSIKDLLQSDISNNSKKRIIAEGWLMSLRKQKTNTFFHLNDGSCLTSLQVVADSNLCQSDLSYGSSVRVEGDLVPSIGSGQKLELQATDVHVYGLCDGVEFPFTYRSRPSLEILRRNPHLRPRIDYNSCLLRVRNAASMAIHKFFQDNGFIFIHTPMITSNDCEGAGEVFTVQGPVGDVPENDVDDDVQDNVQEEGKDKSQFFGHPVFLTVSGQLHLEAIARTLEHTIDEDKWFSRIYSPITIRKGSFRQAYSFGPTFRAENAVGRHHLCEFYMIEAEIAFTQTLECIMKVMEDLIKTVTEEVMGTAVYDVTYYRGREKGDRDVLVEKLCKNKFERLTYTDCVKILEKNNDNFQFKVSWGSDLQKEHEQYLVQHCDDIPVFVTDFPAVIKPFYTKINPDNETVAAVDLLFPDCGELCGGSLREDCYDTLKSRMDSLGLSDHYKWYLDLRKFGSVPHGGFGMGLERYLQFLLGIPNIKDTIPFPRWWMQCKL